MMPRLFILTLGIAIGLAGSAWAQSPASKPAGTGVDATQPANVAEAMQARIVKLAGGVQCALPDAAGVPGPWQEAKVGDLLPAGTRIRTRLRAQVVLTFGDDTVVMIERATLASIDEFHRSGDTKRVKLGLGHGAVRAGVAETTLRSDMSIETPTATLSKKGTIDFGIEYEPSTGRFRIFLARQGLVEALDKLTGQSRMVQPGQYVTEAMIRWIDMAVFDRAVMLTDVFSMTGPEQLFNVLNDTGLGVMEPGGGSGVADVGVHFSSGGIVSGAGPFGPGTLGLAALSLGGSIPGPAGPRIVNRSEGNFGTGNGRLPAFLSNLR